VRSAYVFDIVSSQLVDASARIDQEGFIKFFPDDQWVKEIVSLESQVWASLQVAIADYFIGAKARDRFAEKYSRPATDEGEKNLCVMMKMRRSGGFVLAFPSTPRFAVDLHRLGILTSSRLHLSLRFPFS
jgi:hypothetical protein